MEFAIIFAGAAIMWGMIFVSNSLDKIAKALATPSDKEGGE